MLEKAFLPANGGLVSIEDLLRLFLNVFPHHVGCHPIRSQS